MNLPTQLRMSVSSLIKNMFIEAKLVVHICKLVESERDIIAPADANAYLMVLFIVNSQHSVTTFVTIYVIFIIGEMKQCFSSTTITFQELELV